MNAIQCNLTDEFDTEQFNKEIQLKKINQFNNFNKIE